MSAPKFRMRGTTTASETETTQKKTSTAPKFRMRGAGGDTSPSLPMVTSQAAGETAGRKKAGKNAITGKISGTAKSQRKVAEEKTKPDTLLNILMRDTGHISEVVDSTTGQVISTPEPSRGGSMLKGAAQGTAAGFTSTGGTFLDLLRSYDTAGSSYTRRANQEEENAAHYREMLERGTLDDGTPITASMRQQLEMLASRADSRSTGYRDAAVKQHAPIARATQSVYDTADRLAAQSAQNIAEAKEGLGSVGQFAVDVGVAGTQLAGDALLAALTGGSALVPMAVRGFGSGTQQARQKGATLGQQVAYGAGSAALSVATEQISNIGLFRRAFGAGVADNLAGKLVSRFGENTAVQVMNRLAQTPAGRVVASALGEGGEEAVEALVQPVLQRITYDDAALQQYQDPNYRADVIYQTLVGGTLGGLGGAVNIANRRATDAAGTAQTETAPVSTTQQASPTQSVTAQNTPASTPTAVNATERGFSHNIATDENMDPEIRESFQEDPETYFRLGNQKTLAKAQEIFDAGFESARSTLEQAIGQAQAGRKLPPEMVPLSRMVANQLARNGDVYSARKILSDISVELTEAGQLGQAAAILRRTDAATKVQTIEGLVKRMNEKFGSPKQQITVNDALIQKYTEARTDSERDTALDDIYQNIADQVPSTLVDKFNALRYLNMLGNLKTQVRNVGGNTVMMGVRFARGKVQAMMEAAVSKATGGKIQRTTTFFRDKNLYQEAKQDFEKIQAEAMGQRRYSDYMSAAPSAIQDRRAIFKNSGTWGTKENSPAIARSVRQFTDILWKPLEGYRRLTNEAMERGDVFFSRRAYADALSRFLKANGVTAEQFRSGSVDPDLLERARTHAIQEAQEATFRDDNAFSDMVSSIGFKNANTAPKKAANLAVQGLLPFKRTPANVAVRAYEYSPAAIITTAVQAAQKAKGNENVTGADIIDSLSKTLTGTGIFALGMALFSRGMLTAGPDDDERQAAFDELTGKQDYALILPKGIAEQVGLPEGINFTLDWMSPAAMPLFMGAEFMKAAEDGGISFSDALSAVSSMSDVMLDMSMLQGINDQLSNVSYAEDPLVDLVLNTLTDYLTQGLTSTLAGQLERTFEPERMSTYTQEGQQLPTDFQYELGSASSRIPGWDYQQIPYIDAWGRTEETGDFFERLVNNTLNPSYISQIDLDAVEQELQRVYDATGESVFPSRADKTITSGGREKNLTAEEYTRYAKDLGQTRYRYAQDAMRSSAYRSMSSGDKAKFIGKMYEVANAQAKKNAWSAYQYDSEMESYAEAEAAGISATEFYVAKNTLNNIESDKDKNGESINGTRKPKVIDAINEMDLTPEEKDWLFLREYDSDSAKREVRRLPWN